MRRIRKRGLAGLLAALLLLLLILPGCGSDSGTDQKLPVYVQPEEPVTLRIVYDGNAFPGPQGLLQYLKDMAGEFEDLHTNVTIVLEEFSDDGEGSVEAFRQELEEDLSKGEGPDIYLLSTGATTSPYMQAALFEDVNQAMQDGLFLDIGDYYDADTELTAGLNAAVMDAGVVNGFRYTLPIRFDYPVAAVNLDALQEAGLNIHMFDKGISEVLDWITETENPELAAAADYNPPAHCFPFFSDLVDYDTGEVLVTQDEIAEFLGSWYPYHKLEYSAAVESGQASFTSYLDQQTWLQRGDPIKFCSLETALQNTAFAEALGIPLELVPLTGTDGQLVAEVALFGAVGANCPRADLAYEFLRQFLTEEVQWESEIPGKNMNPDNMMFAGYPVRTEGAASTYYRNLSQKALAAVKAMPWLAEEMNNPSSPVSLLSPVELSDEDVPILQTEIDVVRYPLSTLECVFGWSLTSTSSDLTWEDVDMDAVAADLIRELEQHLQEN